MLDASGEFHGSETPDTMARPQNLEEDGDLPFSEPPVVEKDDHSEDEDTSGRTRSCHRGVFRLEAMSAAY